jgi:hypothetical protein
VGIEARRWLLGRECGTEKLGKSWQSGMGREMLNRETPGHGATMSNIGLCNDIRSMLNGGGFHITKVAGWVQVL